VLLATFAIQLAVFWMLVNFINIAIIRYTSDFGQCNLCVPF